MTSVLCSNRRPRMTVADQLVVVSVLVHLMTSLVTTAGAHSRASILCPEQDVFGGRGKGGGGSLFGSLCPPPMFPDIFEVFASTLDQSAVMRNASRTACLGAPAFPSCIGPGCLAPFGGGKGCVAGKGPSCRSGSPASPATDETRKQLPSDVDVGVQYSRSVEDVEWSESQNPVLDDPDSGLQAPSAYQSTATITSSKPVQPSSVSQLWASIHGRLLIVAVSVTMLASVAVFTVWICLRRHLQKYDPPPQTEEAVCMYGRVLADRTRTTTTSQDTDSSTRRHHHHQQQQPPPLAYNNSAASVSTATNTYSPGYRPMIITSNNNERTFITAGTYLQPVRKYL